MTARNTIRPDANIDDVRMNTGIERGDGSVADGAALYSRLNRSRKSSRTSPLIYAAPAALVAIGLGVVSGPTRRRSS